jgi:proline iminopeptidase
MPGVMLLSLYYGYKITALGVLFQEVSRLKKHFAFSFFLCVFLWHASSDCWAQSPREGFITAPDSVRLFYKVVGSGAETLVAVHGGPGNSLTSILPDLEPLSKNRTVIYYDQRGGGRSDLVKDEEKLSIRKHIEDLETVRQFFKLDKMALLGNSWGGLLIAYYAVAHPNRVERLILHSSAPPTKVLLSDMDDELQRRLKRLYTDEQLKRLSAVANMQNWLKSPDPRAVCREMWQTLFPVYVAKVNNDNLIKGDVCSGPEDTVRRQRMVMGQIWRSLGDYNLLPSLSVVKAPVLVIHGVADPIPVASSEAWTRTLPNARLLIINGAGHMPQFEQPEVFFKAVETFLNGDFPSEATKVQTSTEKSGR